MSLVIDAGVALKLLIAEKESDAAHRLVAGGEALHAPRLMVSEIANALLRKARMGEVERRRVGALSAAVAAMPVRWHADETLGADAVRLALALDRPVGDCVYLALAHRLGARLVTADSRLAGALASTEHGYTVSALGEFAKTHP